MAGPEGFAMPAIALRQDFDAARLRALARASKDARQVRRLLALAAVYDGASRGEAAALGGMDRQLLRDWAVRFNAEGPDGLIDRKAPGARPKLTPEQLSTVVRLVEDGPIPAIHGVVRWRLVDLAGWIYDEYGVSLDPSRLGRILKGLGYVRLSARPKHHAQNEHALEAFKRDFPPQDPRDPRQAPARDPARDLVPG
jgi:transposase